jgi:tRNA/rRNA methyltransferase
VADPIGPVIVLVEPQLGENIGTTARAMANFGLSRLRLVRPRQEWPNDKAVAAASGSDHILAAAELFDSLEAAVSDLSYVLATTRRSREVAKRVRGPDEAAVSLVRRAADGETCGVLFGRERWGLTNAEIGLADEIVTLPVDPAHASLNIAQAVLIVAYEWRLAAVGPDLPFAGSNEIRLADKADLLRLFDHLESALDDAGFFRPTERRPHMVLALRAILQRAELSEQDVRTLRGVVAAFQRPRVAKAVPEVTHPDKDDP